MPAGHGGIDLFGFAHGVGGDGTAGLGARYQHHITDGLSAYAEGRIGRRWGQNPGLDYQAIGGLSWWW